MADQNTSSIEIFNNCVNERYIEFKNCIASFMATLAQDDKQSKTNHARLALDAAISLRQVLATKDQPAWLYPITQTLHNYIASDGNSTCGTELIHTIGLHFRAI
jgi:hypothetical protein